MLHHGLIQQVDSLLELLPRGVMRSHPGELRQDLRAHVHGSVNRSSSRVELEADFPLSLPVR